MSSDARTLAALARLTANEKECLRRILQQHQTAKEIALDLGVSPHAIEKRLKMARTKLGLSSSLEAARLLAEAEGYQQIGPQWSDLVQRARDDHKPASRRWLAGGIVMSLVLAAALVFALQTPEGSIAIPAHDEASPTTAEQIDAVVTQNFRSMDRDRSGFLEAGEIPAPDDEARRTFIAAGDTDHDGKLDLAESRAWLAPIIARQGDDWRQHVEAFRQRGGD